MKTCRMVVSMKTVVLISRCIFIKNRNCNQFEYSFHFKGFYCGEKLTSVIIKSRRVLEIELKSDYLLYIGVRHIKNGQLSAKLLKLKPLSECHI